MFKRSMVKTITITEDAYVKIKKIKRDGESFSELFARLAEGKKGDISDFFGALKLTEDKIVVERKRWKNAREKLDKDLEAGLNARARYFSNN